MDACLRVRRDPTGHKLVAPEPQRGEFCQACLSEIKEVVDLAARVGIYTVVDMHAIDVSYTLGGDGTPAWATAHGSPAPDRDRGPGTATRAGMVGSYGILWVNAR